MSISAFAKLSGFPKHALLIAEIIGSWSLLEDDAIRLLSIFAGIDQYQADLMLSQLPSPRAKLDVIQAAGRFTFKMFPKELARMDKLFEGMRARLDRRNTYAHAVYVVDLRGRLCVMRRKYEVENSKNLRPLPLAELQTEAAEYVRLRRELLAVEKAAWDMLPPETLLALPRIWSARRSLRPSHSASQQSRSPAK